MMKNTCIFLAAFFLAACGSSAGYKTEKDGVVVKVTSNQPSGIKNVRLQVVNDKVIHVSATPNNNFSNEESLIVIPQNGEMTPFNVVQDGNNIILSTAALKAYVNNTTGEVKFTDPNGVTILEEKVGGGKSFEAIEVEGTKGYTLLQEFESPADEAFYGLGQHQADEFNYKGKNEELFQYNTKVAVPFILSNKNYGILWDNYSLSRIGDPRDYSQLNEVFKIFNENGKPGGLTGIWKPAKSTGATTLVRTEPYLYFENLKANRELLPQGFPLNGANVTFEGTLEAPETGTYNFLLYYAGYVKVYFDDKLVVPERWRTAWNPNSYKFTMDMVKDQPTQVRIEWQPDGGESYCGLRVLSPRSAEDQQRLTIWSEMGNEIDYYFVAGDNMDEVISGYRTLTGKAPIMPKWAMGYWQSREKYNTQKEMLDVLREFRERNIPIDNIVLDWNHWPEDQWGSHEFDLNRFPNPKEMVDTIHDMNARIMISVWPKFYTNTEHFKEFDEKGWIYQQAVIDSLRDWVGPGYTYSFYDAYDPEARKLFWNQMKDHYYPLGIDAWWMDASEPNVRDCTDLEYRKALSGPTALGPATKYFNAYALMNAEAIYDGQREVEPNRRVFLLTRSGFAGLQRYSTATWSGDIATRWEDLKAQISAGLNFAMSGIPYWTMDIGGFCVEKRYENAQAELNNTGKANEDYKEWRELNTRWYQFGAFSPLFRAHGQYPYREVWNIAPEGSPTYNSIVWYTNLRYRLMPYIYSLAGKTHFEDYTMMRALVMDHGKDKNVLNIGDEFMFGPNLLVAPVYEYGARSREVYFPNTSGWYNFYTGQYINGGQELSIEAPYERIPLFVPAGAIIPYGPAIQYTDEKPADYLTIYVYGGKDGEFKLYEDEGTNYDYERGLYSTIHFSYDNANKTLHIGKQHGEYANMVKDRTFNIVYVDSNHPIGYNPDAKGLVVNYNGESQSVKL